MIFRVAERVDADPAEVWRYLTVPELMGCWMEGVTDLTTSDGGPLSARSQLLFTARGAQRSCSVVEYEDRRSLALRSTQGSFTATYRYLLDPESTACRLTVEAEGAAVGLLRLAAPMIRLLMRWADRGQALRIRQAVETGALPRR